MDPVLPEPLSALMRATPYCVTHLNTKEPPPTMATSYTLRCLTILPKMHVKVFLHGLFALHCVGKPETTLLTLHWHTIVEEMYYVWTMSGENLS